ncbi:MAG: ATP-binding protein [Myxococcota bacterium]
MTTPREVSPELKAAMKALRLGQQLATLPERLALAERDRLSVEDFLVALFTDEVERRNTHSTTRRAAKAGLDPEMVFERWDPSTAVHYDKRILRELSTLRFIEARRNAAILGPVGVGKTFIANALGFVACRSGFHVQLYRADALLKELRQSRMDNSRDALMLQLSTVDLLIIDDFALEPMTREESRDIYQLFVERNARAATVVTSNRDTAEWLAVFDDTLLAQSAVDRFKNNAYDLVIEGDSYRARLKPTIPDEDPSTAPVVKQTNIGKRKAPPRAR